VLESSHAAAVRDLRSKRHSLFLCLFSVEHLGGGQLYLMTTKNKQAEFSRRQRLLPRCASE